MAIGSAAIPFNIDFVLDHLQIRKYFSAVISADGVAVSNPHPETFFTGSFIIKIKPQFCIFFEDAPKGVEASRLAGIPSIVLTIMHNRNEFPAGDHIIHFIKDYTDPFILSLF